MKIAKMSSTNLKRIKNIGCKYPVEIQRRVEENWETLMACEKRDVCLQKLDKFQKGLVEQREILLSMLYSISLAKRVFCNWRYTAGINRFHFKKLCEITKQCGFDNYNEFLQDPRIRHYTTRTNRADLQLIFCVFQSRRKVLSRVFRRWKTLCLL